MPRIKQRADAYADADFAKGVRVQLVMLGMSQRDLAEKCGVSPATISFWLANPQKMAIGNLRKLIHVTKLPEETALAVCGY